MAAKKKVAVELSEKTEEVLSERPLTEKVPLEELNKKLLFLGIFIFLGILGATAVVYYSATQVVAQKEVVQVVEKISETSAVEIKLEPLSREEISLEILNGTGVSGEAARVAETFEELGYKIIRVGNAPERENQNRLYTKGNLEALLVDAEEKLGISEVDGELLDSTASARIILGR